MSETLPPFPSGSRAERLHTTLLQAFGHTPTQGQATLMHHLCRFVFSDKPNPLFVLRGFAGTGKSSLVGALVQALPQVQHKTVLLAPTGRASKVLAAYSKKSAYTIHKKIYQTARDDSGFSRFVLTTNTHQDTLFLVDEASMIGEEGDGLNLLEDLLEFVYGGNNCRLMLIGDTAQLPPVGLDLSPALDAAYLRRKGHFTVGTFELTEVMRQSEGGILFNATRLRQQLADGNDLQPRFALNNFKDIAVADGYELQEVLESAYKAEGGKEETLLVCRSNKRANAFNQQIRSRILGFEQELCVGDLLMVVKNNYGWLGKKAKADFIANGDTLEVLRVSPSFELHGFRFINATVRMIDYEEDPEIDCRLLLDTLSVDGPALSRQQQQALYRSVEADHQHIRTKGARMQAIRSDHCLNALQVKFAYAVTCHKAQGGQWNRVFVDQGYFVEDMLKPEYLRWLYTALTRARQQAYLLGFGPAFFEAGHEPYVG